MNTSFTTRDSYLEFVNDWKMTYAALTEAVRQKRYGSVKAYRLEKAGQRTEAAEIRLKINAAQDAFNKLRNLIHDVGPLPCHTRPNTEVDPIRAYSSDREIANYLLALRKYAKQKAQKQYQEEHKELVAA